MPSSRAQATGADAEALADSGRLDRRGWRWPLHKPLLESALAAGLPVKSGNLSRENARAIARGTAALSVGFVEVRDGLADPAAYGPATYDYVWFTAAIARGDPCTPG